MDGRLQAQRFRPPVEALAAPEHRPVAFQREIGVRRVPGVDAGGYRGEQGPVVGGQRGRVGGMPAWAQNAPASGRHSSHVMSWSRRLA